MDEKKIDEVDLTSLTNEFRGSINEVFQTIAQLQTAIESQKVQNKEITEQETVLELIPDQFKNVSISEMTEAKNAAEIEKVKTFSVKGQQHNETDSQAITREIKNFKDRKEQAEKQQIVTTDFLQMAMKSLQQQIQASRKEPYNFQETEYTSGSPDDLFDEVNSLTKNPPSWIK